LKLVFNEKGKKILKSEIKWNALVSFKDFRNGLAHDKISKDAFDKAIQPTSLE